MPRIRPSSLRVDTAGEARERILEMIEFADQDLRDVARSRAAELEVLDLLDESPALLDLAGRSGTRRQDTSRSPRSGGTARMMRRYRGFGSLIANR